MALDQPNGNYVTTPMQGGTGTTGESLTTNTPDPWRDQFLKLIAGQLGTGGGAIPGYTLGALENFTSNPSAAAEYFPQLAEPLLNSLKPAEERETTQLTDLFRKAGGTANSSMQNGSFAQAGRQLIGDQANRRQELLAKQYVPLTSQLSENMTNAIKMGLNVPGATADTTRILASLATGLQPLSTHTQTTGTNAQIGAAGGQTTQQQADQIAQQLARYQSLNGTGGGPGGAVY
jgi:hypothetical protein